MLFSELPTWLLSQAGHRAHNVLSARLAEAGARGYDYRVLQALSENAPLSQVAIGSIARLDRRDVAVTLAALEEDALIERSPDPDDARRNVVEMTPAGRARLAQLDAIVASVQEEVLAPLDDDARGHLLAALRLIAGGPEPTR